MSSSFSSFFFEGKLNLLYENLHSCLTLLVYSPKSLVEYPKNSNRIRTASVPRSAIHFVTCAKFLARISYYFVSKNGYKKEYVI